MCVTKISSKYPWFIKKNKDAEATFGTGATYATFTYDDASSTRGYVDVSSGIGVGTFVKTASCGCENSVTPSPLFTCSDATTQN